MSVMHSKPLVIVLLGPTASGKTVLSLDIAERLSLPIINIDSRQLYIGMNIGTAKPTSEQRSRVHHHLLEVRKPDQPITLQEFQLEAENCIEQELIKNGMALLVGGSGLYLKALIKGFRPPAVPPQPKLRYQLGLMGQEICHPLLKLSDSLSAQKISPSDWVRTQRALEVLYATGLPMSSQLIVEPPPWRVLEIGLDPSNLYQRIEIRTKQLYRDGLVNETKNLANTYGFNLPLLKTIGYGEALSVIAGSKSKQEAIGNTTHRTRKFAKRQRTWFRNQHHPHWLPSNNSLAKAMTLIEQQLR